MPCGRPTGSSTCWPRWPPSPPRPGRWRPISRSGPTPPLALSASPAWNAGSTPSIPRRRTPPPNGLVGLADEYCRVSALMPQKKNPYALAFVRHSGGVAAGALAGFLGVLRTGSARTDHFLTAAGDVQGALVTVTGAVDLL